LYTGVSMHNRQLLMIAGGIILLMGGLGAHVANAQSNTTQDQLLISNGVEQSEAREQLQQLQLQINEQSQKTTDPKQQLQMIQQRLDILHTLTLDARLNQQPRELKQLQQALRSDAWKLRQSDNPQQQIIGEYWHLLCDMADIRRLTRDLESSQRACISKMQQFLEKHTQSIDPIQPQTLHIIEQVRLALLQIYDQRGQSDLACKLIATIKQQSPDNETLAQYLNQNYGYCHLIGRKFNTRLTTTDGKTWDSREKLGKPIVIYFWPGVGLPADIQQAAPNKSTDPMWQWINETRTHVLLVDLSHANESGLQIPSSRCPSYREDADRFKLTSFFNIQSIPRVIVIDKKGIVRSIGGPTINSTLERVLAEK